MSRTRFDGGHDADNVNLFYCVGLLGFEEKTAPVGKCTQSSESAKTGEKITDGVIKDKGRQPQRRSQRRRVEATKEEGKEEEAKS